MKTSKSTIRRIVIALGLAMALGGHPPRGSASGLALTQIPVNQIHRAAVVLNPHLKGVDRLETKITRPVKTKTQAIVHHPWHRRWDYQTWMVVHRGLGTIRGFVHGPGGGAVTSAKVWLRHPNGAPFRLVSRKHITYADSEGNFVMFGVRAGRYRVLAQRGKEKGRVQIAVHPGLIAEASVKL
jgi:hypothetical protein